jgi:hypothetical protein
MVSNSRLLPTLLFSLSLFFVFSLPVSAYYLLDDFDGSASNRNVELLPLPDEDGSYPPSGHGEFSESGGIGVLKYGINGTFLQGVNLTYSFTSPLDVSPYPSLGFAIVGCSRTQAAGLDCSHLELSMVDDQGNRGQLSTGFGDINQNSIIVLPLELDKYINYSNIVQINIIFTATSTSPSQILSSITTLSVQRISFSLSPSPVFPDPSFPPFVRRRFGGRYKAQQN